MFFVASKRLSDLIRRPYDLYRAGVFDEYFMGLMNQVAQAMDDSITQEVRYDDWPKQNAWFCSILLHYLSPFLQVTNHLFKKVGAKFGMDLVSFNMQRGREFGIPSYMEFRWAEMSLNPDYTDKPVKLIIINLLIVVVLVFQW